MRLAHCSNISDKGLEEVANKLSLLEELDISFTSLSKHSLEAIGRCCPYLTTLKFNKLVYDGNNPYLDLRNDDEAFAIAKTMPKLCHLELLGNKLSNDGLVAILGGCNRLESLDVRGCFNVDLGASLGESYGDTDNVLAALLEMCSLCISE
ncbi:hypothetical protein VNO77_43607 [Canavalia gladiata]|uniref:Uncharacterized protein n=1 Tax=Canavalia gladiata TaxID=3824 RepID=A0AAN9JV48_CANGL